MIQKIKAYRKKLRAEIQELEAECVSKKLELKRQEDHLKDMDNIRNELLGALDAMSGRFREQRTEEILAYKLADITDEINDLNTQLSVLQKNVRDIENILVLSKKVRYNLGMVLKHGELKDE